MTLASIKDELSTSISALPSHDWMQNLIADDVKAVEKKVDEFERGMRHWRTDQSVRTRKLIDLVKREFPEARTAETFNAVEPLIKEALKAIDGSILSFSTPVHENPLLVDRLEALTRLSPGAGRFMRKALRRIERIRVEVYNACIDFHYALLSVETDFDPDATGGETFSSGSQLAGWLRKNAS